MLPDDSMYMPQENVNRKFNYDTLLADVTTNSIATHSTATYSDATNSTTTYSTATYSDATHSASIGEQQSRLPRYWKVKMTSDGEIYYLNLITNEKSSTRPSV